MCLHYAKCFFSCLCRVKDTKTLSSPLRCSRTEGTLITPSPGETAHLIVGSHRAPTGPHDPSVSQPRFLSGHGWKTGDWHHLSKCEIFGEKKKTYNMHFIPPLTWEAGGRGSQADDFTAYEQWKSCRTLRHMQATCWETSKLTRPRRSCHRSWRHTTPSPAQTAAGWWTPLGSRQERHGWTVLHPNLCQLLFFHQSLLLY